MIFLAHSNQITKSHACNLAPISDILTVPEETISDIKTDTTAVDEEMMCLRSYLGKN